jgi:hypothetical protein
MYPCKGQYKLRVAFHSRSLRVNAGHARTDLQGRLHGGGGEGPRVEDPGLARQQVRCRRRRRRRQSGAGGGGVLLGVRGRRAGALRGAGRARQQPALPAPPRRRRARVRLRGAGPARAARLRRRRVPRRHVTDGAPRRWRWQRRRRRRFLAHDVRLNPKELRDQCWPARRAAAGYRTLSPTSRSLHSLRWWL